jgi:hypothetical protein
VPFAAFTVTAANQRLFFRRILLAGLFSCALVACERKAGETPSTVSACWPN